VDTIKEIKDHEQIVIFVGVGGSRRRGFQAKKYKLLKEKFEN